MITLGGEKTWLVRGPNDDHRRELAEEGYVEIRNPRRVAPESVGSRAADVTGEFLKHSRIHFAPDTHRMNVYYCQLFAEACGQALACEMTPVTNALLPGPPLSYPVLITGDWVSVPEVVSSASTYWLALKSS